MRLSPGNLDRLHAAVWTLRPRYTSGQNRLKLHGVQMPPRPLRSMVLERSHTAAVRTTGRLANGMLQPNLNLLLLQRKVDVHHLPRAIQPQQPSIMCVESVHPPNLPTPSQNRQTPTSSTHKILRRTQICLVLGSSNFGFLPKECPKIRIGHFGMQSDELPWLPCGRCEPKRYPPHALRKNSTKFFHMIRSTSSSE